MNDAIPTSMGMVRATPPERVAMTRVPEDIGIPVGLFGIEPLENQ
jgi:hypothetical protein